MSSSAIRFDQTRKIELPNAIGIFVVILLICFSGNLFANDKAEFGLESYAKSSMRIGKLDFYRTYQYSFKSSGNLSQLNVDIGQQFSSGDILASVDIDELNSELNSLLAEKTYVNAELKRLTELQKQKVVSASDVERLRSQSSQLKAAIIRSRQLISAATIVAPYDGIVISRALELGEFVAPGQMVLEIAPIEDNLVVDVDVLESELANLTYGADISLHTRNSNRAMTGKVKKLTSTPNQVTGLYRVSLAVEPFERMTIGTMFNVALEEQLQYVFKVPAHLAKIDFNQTALVKIKSDTGQSVLTRFDIVDFNQDFVMLKPNGLSKLQITK